jgi:hypothetical protein
VFSLNEVKAVANQIINLKKYRMKKNWKNLHITLRIGILGLLIGTSPILILIGLDSLGVLDAGNALGPGTLVFISFWPSIILIAIGSVLTFLKRRKASI